MRKINELIKTQATYEFKQKRQEIIKNTLKKKSKSKKQFEDYLKLYNII